MNVAQTIFTIFFAILWGVSANAWPKWRAFNFAPARREWRGRRRIVWSFLMLNIVPAAYVVLVLPCLKHSGFDSVTRAAIGAGIAPAFAIFGFYHVWIVGVEIWPKGFYFGAAELKSRPYLAGDPSIECLNLGTETWLFHLLMAVMLYWLLPFGVYALFRWG